MQITANYTSISNLKHDKLVLTTTLYFQPYYRDRSRKRVAYVVYERVERAKKRRRKKVYVLYAYARYVRYPICCYEFRAVNFDVA